MRVFIVSYLGPSSGTQVAAYYNLLQQTVTEAEIKVVTAAESPWVIRRLASLYLGLAKAFFPGGRGIATIRFRRLLLGSVIRKVPRDPGILFHAQDPISAYMIRRRFQLNVIITTCHYHDDPVTEFNLQFKPEESTLRGLQKLFRKFFKASDHFICVTSAVAQKSRFLMPAGAQISVINNVAGQRADLTGWKDDHLALYKQYSAKPKWQL